ncbi:hypothetical protein NKI20_24335 [Mesorhizobium sp. M0830]|uniref:hypothetical protein n=1 Tax=Mesorhizobium sp. M0830 TaxID=2957008 RepID=UPI00333E0C9B
MTLAGIAGIEAANRFIAETYLPAHNARFSKLLCIEVERIVDRDNTTVFGRLRLQLPPSPIRHHFVKATVKVRQYPQQHPRRLPRTTTYRPLRCRRVATWPNPGQERGVNRFDATNRSGHLMCCKNRTS